MIQVRAGAKDYKFVWRHLPGFQTQCIVFVDGKTSDGHFFFETVRCHPHDPYSKEGGRRVSLARLLGRKELGFMRWQRIRVWEAYWNRLPEGKRPTFRQEERGKNGAPDGKATDGPAGAEVEGGAAEADTAAVRGAPASGKGPD